MIYLLIVSLIWGFSFGLIKTELTGLSSYLVSFIRLGISFILFVSFFRLRLAKNRTQFLKLLLLGMVQFGLMYVLYIHAYKFLKSYEIVLFTIFTPIFIVIFDELFNKKISLKSFIAPMLAIIGTAIIVFKGLTTKEFYYGFLLMQGSNIAFAFGQIFYRNIKQTSGEKDSRLFSVIYLGAFLFTLLTVSVSGDLAQLNTITLRQWMALGYLGVIASGLCFYLWNKGASKISSEGLSVMNNLKIPIAIIISLIVFGEKTNLIRLIIGTSIMLYALYISDKRSKNAN